MPNPKQPLVPKNRALEAIVKSALDSAPAAVPARLRDAVIEYEILESRQRAERRMVATEAQ